MPRNICSIIRVEYLCWSIRLFLIERLAEYERVSLSIELNKTNDLEYSEYDKPILQFILQPSER